MACYSPFYVESPKAAALGHPRGIPVPCGKCPNCKRRRVSEWAFRLRQEDRISAAAFFITLTYEVPPLTSRGFMTLQPRDLTLFWKRLRKSGLVFKYYAVGEYGSTRKRPHYHAILFLSAALTETECHKIIDRSWGLGGVHVGGVSGASIAYTLKYIDKPTRIPEHRNDDRVKEFSRSSTGLGASYVTDDIKKYHNLHVDELFVRIDGYKVPMSRFYRNKILSDRSKALYQHHSKKARDEQDAKLRVDFALVGDFRDLDVIRAEARIIDDRNFYNQQKPRDV